MHEITKILLKTVLCTSYVTKQYKILFGVVKAYIYQILFENIGQNGKIVHEKIRLQFAFSS